MYLKLKTFSVFIIIVFFLLGCNKKENKNEVEQKKESRSEIVKLSRESIKDIGLTIDTISYKPFTETITIPAKVLVDQDNEAQVGSLVQGRVNKVLVKIGDYVKAGQPLMNLEGLEIGVIKSNFLKAKASLDYVKSNFERQKTLNEQKIGSQKSFLEAQSEYEKALAELKAEDKKIHSIGLTDEEILDNKNNSDDAHTSGTLTVKAPINGVVVERNVVIGQMVDGTTNAFRIINTNSIWIDGQIYEKDINKVKEKNGVSFTVSSYPNEIFSGKINYIGYIIDEKTRTITIRAEFFNPTGKLKPQMYGEMYIPIGNSSKSILISAESIIKINNADFVFIQKDDTTFEKRSVATGKSEGSFIEIKEGLKEGEKVVSKGAFFLKSEMLKDELGGE
jgi:membrane fusion protein, heavy metal efflux system